MDYILLLKKFRDFYKGIDSSIIVDILNRELNNELSNFPEYQEPDYVTEDLLTIFSKHVFVKRRKSEAIKRKSLNISNQSSHINNKLQKKSVTKRKSKSFVNEIITERNEAVEPESQIIHPIQSNSCQFNGIVNNEDDRDEEQDNSFIVTDTDETFHQEVYRSGSLNLEGVKPIGNLHQLYEESVIKPVILMSQRSSIPDVCSSQVSSPRCNAYKDECDHQSIFSDNIEMDQTSNIEDVDVNSIYIISDTEMETDHLECVGKSSNHLFPHFDNNLEYFQDYEENRNDIKPIKIYPIEKIENTNNSPTRLTYSSSLIDYQEVTHHDLLKQNAANLYSNQEQETNTQETTKELSIYCDETESDYLQDGEQNRNNSKTLETVPEEKIDNINNFPTTLTHSPSFVDSQVMHHNLLEHSPANFCSSQEQEINTQLTTREFSIQCNEIDLIENDNREGNSLKRRRMMSDGQDKENCITILDVDEDNLMTPADRRSRRSRSSSLSSLESLQPIEKVQSRQVLKSIRNSKKQLNPQKPIVIFNDNPRLDMERRILLSSGWLIWPITVMSSLFKSFDISTFQTILNMYGEEDCSKYDMKRDIFGQCLTQMANSKLIVKVTNKEKKLNFFLKYPVLPPDVLDLYEISEEKYSDILWYKSSGPRDGRKISAQLAPKVVKDLLEEELTFVQNLLNLEDEQLCIK